MTTTDTATPTVTETLAKLQQARAKWLDPLDIPRTLTQRQIDAYVATTATLDATIRAIQQTVSALVAPTRRLREWLPVRERNRAAKATLEKHRDDAPDWRTIGPRPAQAAPDQRDDTGPQQHDAGRFWHW